jgi:predicted AAA+ superfamily ATPase
MKIIRSLHPLILADLKQYDQMLFIAGPRQCGKTTLAQAVLDEIGAGRYWNYDIPEDQILLSRKPSFFEEIDRKKGEKPLVVFDEIHKYPLWKNVLKGAYDRSRTEFRFLVTGSGRLDLFQKGGDSLAGRYFLNHLFPLTINELANQNIFLESFLKNPDELPEGKENAWPNWQALERLSGFPEPYIRGERAFYRRWVQSYGRQIIREDIRDLTHIRHLGQMELLGTLLPERVGSLLSINSLRGDIKVSFETLKNWIEIFENFFYVFLVPPWSRNVSRAIQKEPKLYLYNWSNIADPGARFENMVALHLYRSVTLWNERGAGEFGLHFVRDRQKNEVDFLIIKGKTPFLLIETKLEDTDPPPSLIKMKKLFNIPAILLVNRPNISRKITKHEERILVVSADRWLSALP